MRIPSSFELQGRTIRVVLSDEMTDNDGEWDSHKDLITIDETNPRDIRAHSFLHEFVHAALQALGKEDLGKDETFVDCFAGLIHQMLKSSRF
jgi:hypothetical protein